MNRAEASFSSVEYPTDVPMSSSNYQTALQNMADDDDDS